MRHRAVGDNRSRQPEQADAANPRARNEHGHILEIAPAAGDHGSAEGTWSIFLLAGEPDKDPGAKYNEAISANGWLSCPDNIAFDGQGRIWIVTDGAPHPRASPTASMAPTPRDRAGR